MNAFARWLFAPAPVMRLATVRLLIGTYATLYLLIRAPVMADFTRFAPESFEPVAVVRMLSGPLPAWLVLSLYLACVLAAGAFATGYRFQVSGPAFGLLLLWVTSYRNSWGMVFHTDNLLCLHALCLAFVPEAGAALTTSPKTELGPHDETRYGWPLKLLSIITLVTYVLAGLAKLKTSGVAWMDGEILRNYIAYDAVRKLSVGSVHSPLGAWLVQFAWPFPIIGVLTMAFELGAPLALLGRRPARVWVATAVAFHWGVLLVMAIAFTYPLSGVAFASLLEPERLWRLRPLSRLRRKFH